MAYKPTSKLFAEYSAYSKDKTNRTPAIGFMIVDNDLDGGGANEIVFYFPVNFTIMNTECKTIWCNLEIELTNTIRSCNENATHFLCQQSDMEEELWPPNLGQV